MIVAGTSATQLMVSIGTRVCGTNIATMIPIATAIETSAWTSRKRDSRSRCASASATSAASVVAVASGARSGWARTS